VTILSLSKRVNRLGTATGGHLSVAETLERLRERALERNRAWRAAGNAGMPPPEPPAPLEPVPPNAIRADAELWQRLAYGRARVAHDRCEQASPFRDFREIYAMLEADLVQAVNHAEQMVHQAKLEAWQAERSA
jgi:hypothetical protein